MNRKAVVAGTLSLVVSISLVFIGCSGGGGSGTAGPGTLTGIVDLGAAAFHVAAGETVWCVGDVTIRAGSALIEGALLSQAVTGNGTNGSDITLETPGDIVVTGRVAAGSGTAGAAEGKGGDGGDVTLTSSAGDITVGQGAATTGVKSRQSGSANVHAGDAANGGGGVYGRAGGVGGTVVLDCGKGKLTLHQAPGLLHIGNGGDGGNALITGAAMATYAPPGVPSNDGGTSGTLGMVFATLEGAQLEAVASSQSGASPWRVLVDSGVVTGGAGGDGGGVQYGVAPETLATSRSAATPRDVRARAITEQPPPVRGGNGADGYYRGGNGGYASQCFETTDLPPTEGAKGWDADATGGEGGSVVPREYHSLGAGIMSQYVYDRDADVYAGDGGDATAMGGRGANGGVGDPGGDGGTAQAVGGFGAPAPSAGSKRHPGRGGDARAYGGRGGADCRVPPGTGGEGGKGGTGSAMGGDAYAVAPDCMARGGNATATGGAGGAGGDGKSPGAGGPGGVAVARIGEGEPDGSAFETQGLPGAGGAQCPATAKHKVSGRVTVSLGQPLSGITIGWSLYTTTTTPSAVGSRADEHGQVITDADGRYELPGMDDGTYWIQPDDTPAPPQFWNPPMRLVTVAGGDVASQDFVQTTATRTYTLTVHVWTATNAPVAGEQITLVPPDNVVREQATNAAGDAVFSGLWPGVYTAWPPEETGYSYTPESMRFLIIGQDLQGMFRVAPG